MEIEYVFQAYNIGVEVYYFDFYGDIQQAEITNVFYDVNKKKVYYLVSSDKLSEDRVNTNKKDLVTDYYNV